MHHATVPPPAAAMYTNGPGHKYEGWLDHGRVVCAKKNGKHVNAIKYGAVRTTIEISVMSECKEKIFTTK